MESVHFLNLEYLLLRVYQLSTGTDINLDPGSLGAWLASFWGQITILGLAISFILFLAVIWFKIRTVVVEHEGFHMLEERRHALREEAKGNSRWERVVALASSPDEGNWRRAIIEADSMLAELLDDQGYRGESVGENLKDANPLQFTTLDLAWQAHKVRNAIAHLGEAYPLSEREVRATIDLYARVFEEFGII